MKRKVGYLMIAVGLWCLQCSAPSMGSLFAQGVCEAYVCSPLVKPGWYDNGVFDFSLAKKDVYLPSYQSSYNPFWRQDSVLELNYCKFSLNSDELNSFFHDLTLKSRKASEMTCRILLIVHREGRELTADTLEINSRREISYRGKLFLGGRFFWAKLLQFMATDLRYTWMITDLNYIAP